MNNARHIFTGLFQQSGTCWTAVFMLFCLAGQAQVELDRQVIGSAYSEFSNGSDFTLSASVGEAVVASAENTDLIITAGFQQSNYVLSIPFILQLTASDAACLGANNGSVSITFISANVSPPYTYAWSTGSTEAAITQLEVGTYSVTVTGANGNSVTNSVKVETVADVDCTPAFYTGITPNGDGLNDSWVVENAEFFTAREVTIFNRYGAKVWETNAYDNVSAAFTGAHGNGNDLPDGTYYYIAKFDDSTYKGWIEISR